VVYPTPPHTPKKKKKKKKAHADECLNLKAHPEKKKSKKQKEHPLQDMKCLFISSPILSGL
jgi:hypothetical protein